MSVAIIDYNMGNVGSVKNALHTLGVEAFVSGKKEDIQGASHIILPGVGAFGDGMANLKERGLIGILEEEVLSKKKPFLGICIGMQLLAEQGEEGGSHRGLGWIKGNVRRFHIDESIHRVPHVGWNDISTKWDSYLFKNIPSSVYYFVHSYFLAPQDGDVVSATCTYGEEFVAAVQKDNIYAVQFHPEKSQKAGLALLKNFIAI